MQNLMYVDASNQEDLDFDRVLGEYSYTHCTCLVPCAGV